MSEEERLQVSVIVKGIVLPPWVAVCICGAFIVATFALLLVWQASRDEAKEVRLLQLHVQDVENVLIRHGLARREDFATWQAPQPSIEIKPHDKEK